ncbi:MAG: hypothetical protein E8D41_00310 [Nitrospira sp.]|nr:MAG: hypothetical protein E8D41_00310 [Nitrospira sp.]
MKTAMINRTVANIGLIALLWLLCTLTIPGPLQAAIFFDSDFETCNVGTENDFPCQGWDDLIPPGQHNAEWSDEVNANTLEITNVGCFSGSKCIKETFRNNGLAGDGGNKPTIYKTVPRTDHMFFRGVIKRDASFRTCTLNNSTKMWRFRGEGIGGGYPILLMGVRSDRYVVAVEGPYDFAGTYVFTGGPLISTTWQNVELEWKWNTPGVSDGIIRLWVDGVLYIERLNLALRGPTLTSVGLSGKLDTSDYYFNSSQVYAQCGTGALYWDRLAVGDTRIGPAQSRLSSADSTPPARPTLNPIP